MMQQSSLFSNRLALKLAVCRNPVTTICGILLMLLSTQTYLLRIFEGPAYQPHSVYVWDCLWVIFTQATTGYGAEPPSTHLGRLTAVMATMCMPVVIATMTSLSTRSLMLTADEQNMMVRIDRNRLHARAMVAAVKVLQFWYRHPHAYADDRKPQWGLRRFSSEVSMMTSPRVNAGAARKSMLDKEQAKIRRNQLFGILCQAVVELHMYDGNVEPQAAAALAASSENAGVIWWGWRSRRCLGGVSPSDNTLATHLRARYCQHHNPNGLDHAYQPLPARLPVRDRGCAREGGGLCLEPPQLPLYPYDPLTGTGHTCVSFIILLPLQLRCVYVAGAASSTRYDQRMLSRCRGGGGYEAVAEDPP